MESVILNQVFWFFINIQSEFEKVHDFHLIIQYFQMSAPTHKIEQIKSHSIFLLTLDLQLKSNQLAYFSV